MCMQCTARGYRRLHPSVQKGLERTEVPAQRQSFRSPIGGYHSSVRQLQSSGTEPRARTSRFIQALLALLG